MATQKGERKVSLLSIISLYELTKDVKEEFDDKTITQDNSYFFIILDKNSNKNATFNSTKINPSKLNKDLEKATQNKKTH